MPKKINIIGKKFNRLTVLEKVDAGKYQYKYLCQCECGNKKIIQSTSIVQGTTKSCGCIKTEMLIKKNYKHGKSYTSAYKCAWSRVMHMKRKFRLPKWADVEAIRQFYMNKPQGCEVDHIIPLSGKTVSGLHVLENLQYLTIAENRSKNNKFIGV
jgi:5-methylcytosine-specific restriction endonuclease McrA